MVLASTLEYVMTWLYAIALTAELDSGTLFQLTDRQTEVSFKLSKTWKKAMQGGGDASSSSMVEKW